MVRVVGVIRIIAVVGVIDVVSVVEVGSEVVEGDRGVALRGHRVPCGASHQEGGLLGQLLLQLGKLGTLHGVLLL